jgi:hypothetical protein
MVGWWRRGNIRSGAGINDEISPMVVRRWIVE